MDYSHPFFAGGQTFQHQFIGIPPLTPSNSNSAASDEYSTTSPPEAFTEFPNEHFPNFESYASHYAPQPAVFPGPPTPPGQPLPTTVVHAGQPQHPQPVQQPPVTASVASITAPSAMDLDVQASADIVSMAKADPGAEEFTQPNYQQLEARKAGSNSDDDDLTPAQSRRKAQNRAAQRAFRERKERHVKDLEAKLATLEAAQQNTATENERLKHDLQKVNTENEILRATSSLHAAAGASPGSDHPAGSGMPMTTGPMTYNPTDFYTDLLANHDNKTPSHRIATSDAGERLLAAGATWDLIINHDLFKRGLVDVADISNRLKHQARCDGQGPVFEESAIISAIEQSVGSGSDSLL